MLGEAIPDVAPELHAAASAQHRLGLAWIREREAWLAAAGIAMTNVLALRPQGNKLEALCANKKESTQLAGALPPITRGLYLREEYLAELQRLYDELAEWSPNIIVALGNTACWAVIQATNIGSIRGAITLASGSLLGNKFPSMKVLPTYHPAGVLRQWSWRPIVVADLMKAWREAQFPELRRPARRVLVQPTLNELELWVQETLTAPPPLLSPDIETASGQITCIGFARAALNDQSHGWSSEAIVVPFLDRSRPGWHYWPEPWQEERAWELVRQLLEAATPKVGQNFLYDLQYIRRLGIAPKACDEDTMLLHHSRFPEMQKGLGFLGSIYTNESSWKLLRKRKADTEKKDE